MHALHPHPHLLPALVTAIAILGACFDPHCQICLVGLLVAVEVLFSFVGVLKVGQRRVLMLLMVQHLGSAKDQTWVFDCLSLWILMNLSSVQVLHAAITLAFLQVQQKRMAKMCLPALPLAFCLS